MYHPLSNILTKKETFSSYNKEILKGYICNSGVFVDTEDIRVKYNTCYKFWDVSIFKNSRIGHNRADEHEAQWEDVKKALKELFPCVKFDRDWRWPQLSENVYDKQIPGVRFFLDDNKDRPVNFENPAVEVIYNILCEEDAPPYGTHWEGWVAQKIASAFKLGEEKVGVKEFEAIIIEKLDAPNKNGRIYTREVVQSAIDDDSVFGKIGMPDLVSVDGRITCLAPLSVNEITHCVTDMRIEGDMLIGKVRVVESELTKHLLDKLPEMDFRIAAYCELDENNIVHNLTIHSINAVNNGA